MGPKTILEQFYSRYHRPEYLAHDPLEFVHRYRDPLEQEGVAVLSAVMAYGQVRQIRASVESALKTLTDVFGSPRSGIWELGKGQSQPRWDQAIASWVHRFNTAQDLDRLIRWVGRAWHRHGSLGALFLRHQDPQAPDIGEALSRLMDDCELEIPFFLTRPRDGSVCKRWCMFLRWMGRRDLLDPGLWTSASGLPLGGKALLASQLVFPLDTHTARLSKKLGLLERKTLNWKAALEVTEAFRKWDPQDPVRFDFSLCRAGMFSESLEGVLRE